LEKPLKQLFPPKIVIRLFAESYTAEYSHRAEGDGPVGLSCVQVGVPATLFAFDKTHTSLVQGDVFPSAPPNIIIRAVTGS
jgi:hypothetical protein